MSYVDHSASDRSCSSFSFASFNVSYMAIFDELFFTGSFTGKIPAGLVNKVNEKQPLYAGVVRDKVEERYMYQDPPSEGDVKITAARRYASVIEKPPPSRIETDHVVSDAKGKIEPNTVRTYSICRFIVKVLICNFVFVWYPNLSRALKQAPKVYVLISESSDIFSLMGYFIVFLKGCYEMERIYNIVYVTFSSEWL